MVIFWQVISGMPDDAVKLPVKPLRLGLSPTWHTRRAVRPWMTARWSSELLCDGMLCLIIPEKIGRRQIFIESARLKLVDPDPDQIAGDVMPLRVGMQCLAAQILLGNLLLELNAAGSVLRMGLHPPKAQLPGQLLKAIRPLRRAHSNQGDRAVPARGRDAELARFVALAKREIRKKAK
jgi:hypothetical protein